MPAVLLFTLKCHLHADKIINTFLTSLTSLAVILQINYMYNFL